MKVESRGFSGCRGEKVEIKEVSQVFGLGFRCKMVPFTEIGNKGKKKGNIYN